MNFTSNRNFAIHVADLDHARTFYQKTLGFTPVGDSNEKLVFETGKLILYVNKDEKMAFIPALEVLDYEAAKQFLKTSGCEIIREWPNSTALYFRDPLGQVIRCHRSMGNSESLPDPRRNATRTNRRASCRWEAP